MFLLKLAAERRIPATVSITADTDSEKDRICSNGRRLTALQFWTDYVYPYCNAHGIVPMFVRSVNREGEFNPGAEETLRTCAARGSERLEDMIKGMHVPMFTNDKTRGRLRQSCTDKLKIRAINQAARRQGIKLLRNAIGYHSGEAHRIKARFLTVENGFSIYKPQETRDGLARDVQWLEHYYPCVDLGLNREAIRAELDREKLPYLVTSECDCCPHQNYSRWMAHTPEVLADMARLESAFKGKLFFTAYRIPLLEALAVMKAAEESKAKRGQQTEMEFGCENGAYCGF